MLIFADALTAQPFALRSGATFLLRSLSQASTIAGPEITRRIPTRSSIYSHHSKSESPSARVTNAVPIIPRAIPIAAKIPANLAMSNGAAAAALPPSAFAGSAVGAALILSVAFFIILASLSAADLVMRFSMAVAILLYGDQNACATLIGLSTILVTTASQSRPLLS